MIKKIILVTTIVGGLGLGNGNPDACEANYGKGPHCDRFVQQTATDSGQAVRQDMVLGHMIRALPSPTYVFTAVNSVHNI